MYDTKEGQEHRSVIGILWATIILCVIADVACRHGWSIHFDKATNYGFNGDRLLVLGRLNELMKRWIIEVSIEKVSTN